MFVRADMITHAKCGESRIGEAKRIVRHFGQHEVDDFPALLYSALEAQCLGEEVQSGNIVGLDREDVSASFRGWLPIP